MEEGDNRTAVEEEKLEVKPASIKAYVERVNPRVADLLYWREPGKSGVVFGAGLVLLLALTCYSTVRVLAESLLLALGLGLSYRVYKNVMQGIRKEDITNPFEEYLKMDVTLSAERTQKVVELALREINCTVSMLRRLLLVENIFSSLKFGAALWLLTYVGAWFNGLTLVIIGFVFVFALPKLYDTYPEPVDNAYGLVKHHVISTYQLLESRLSFLKRKNKSE